MSAQNLRSDAADAVAARKPGRAHHVHLAEGAVVPAATPAAQGGAPWVEEPTAYDAILLSSFGGPEGQDEVIPFLRNVTSGRGIPDERLEEVAVHYRHYGGISPINQQNRELQAALRAELDRRGIDLPVYWGNRNWEPYVADAISEAHAAGATKLIAIATSAYSSYSSCRQYREDYADALEATGLGDQVQIDKVRPFFDHPGFVTPFVEGTVAAARDLVSEGVPLSEIEFLFTTHSVPNSDADRSGPAERELGPGGAYLAQHQAVSEAIADAVRASLEATELHWQLVFQSRSGPPSQPWLEPDINDVIAELPEAGRRGVVVVPIGFASDHMEVVWDLDNEARDSAAAVALPFRRVGTPGIHPAFVTGLVDLVEERLHGTPKQDRPACTGLGPWYDVCRSGCCENARLGFRPAAAGLQP